MNEDSDIFKISSNKIKPHCGCILISEPFSQDLFFGRSVVFIAEHNEDGTIGFILNRSTEIFVRDVIEDFETTNLLASLGGPVATNSVHFIHSLGNISGCTKILENLFWGGDFEVIRSLVKNGLATEKTIRFFIGYSGWEPGQLASEIERNSWLVSDLNSTEIMSLSGKDAWKFALNKLGDDYKSWLNFPENPNLN
jgi:putative transcriptional regulator